MKNTEFAQLWRDVWFVHTSDQGGGIGHYTTQLQDNEGVVVTCEMDFSDRDGIADGHPDRAEAHMSTKLELTITDVDRFYWTSYNTEEKSTSAAREQATQRKMGVRYEDSYSMKPTGSEALIIGDGTGEEVEFDAPGGGPIVPDFLMPLYVASRPLDKSLTWPVRFLSFDRGGERRKWIVWSSEIRYAGRKGPATGLSHTFESGNVGDGRIFSVWVDDDGSFVGFGDEREVGLVAGDEATARAFLRGPA